ncbi:hypothetical protein [Sediminivirga luteola]|uniref:Uncharacterized protein n=1 Tax=Sediminivirga luteola TaxID=1774748 RepID=A0A8J2TVD2_9MICO|nr:hypothetical protein [Sediminivirga luteola]GGA02798.1 hypothetical protein GCM10011333_01740 [Sediminivirga luteola]
MTRSSAMRAAYALTGLNDPSMGDERERDVILRSYSFALVLAMFLGFLASILLAVVGLGLWSIVPIFVVGIPSWAAIWFAAKEGVDLVALLDKASKSRTRLMWAGTFGFILLWGGALSFHILMGNPLVDIRIDIGDDAGLGPVLGGGIGAVVGLVAAIVALKARSRKTQRQLAAADDD